MRKAICLILAVLTLAAVLSGCTGMMDPNSVAEGTDGVTGQFSESGNVSTAQDGTVNGRNRQGGLDDAVENAADDIRDTMDGENRA